MYAVKHDSHCKARLFPDGNLTETPILSVYSSFVTLCMCLSQAELYKMEVWSANIGNTNEETYTKRNYVSLHETSWEVELEILWLLWGQFMVLEVVDYVGGKDTLQCYVK